METHEEEDSNGDDRRSLRNEKKKNEAMINVRIICYMWWGAEMTLF